MCEQKRIEISKILFPNEIDYIKPDKEFSICKKDNLIELARLYLEKYPHSNYYPDNLFLLIRVMFVVVDFPSFTYNELQSFYQKIEEASFDDAIRVFSQKYFSKYMINHSYDEAVEILDKRCRLFNKLDLMIYGVPC